MAPNEPLSPGFLHHPDCERGEHSPDRECATRDDQGNLDHYLGRPAAPPADVPGEIIYYRCMRDDVHEPHEIRRSWATPGAPVECPGRAAPVPPPVAEPDTDWLMAWASGWLGGYATGYDHGHQDGEREYGESLAEALTPMRRAAAHGIDVALAREAWAEHQRRMRGGATA